MKWLSAALPFLVAPPLLILAAIWQGRETERWGEFPEMKQFAARLEKLPRVIGPWKGTDGDKLDEATRKATKSEGDLTIIYVNQETGEQARMFIDLGRLLDMSKHRPDRCYPAQGYKAESEETEPKKVTTASGSKAEFRTAVYSKEAEGIRTRIYWSWASDGVWKGPEGEDGLRKEFHRTRPVYKLYVDNQVRSADERAGEGPSINLIKVLVPAYDKILFPPDDQETAAKATAEKSTSADAKPANPT